jgi:glycosyltransferase involved in cell wall biosynthesis
VSAPATDPAALEAELDAVEAAFGSASLADVAARLTALLPALDRLPVLRGRVLCDLGVIAHADGQVDAAYELLEAALAADPECLEAIENLADLVATRGDLRRGDPRHALGLRRQATRLMPERADLWVALGNGALACSESPLAHEAAAAARQRDAGVEGLAALEEQLRHLPAPAAPLDQPGKVLIAVEFFHPSSGGCERLAEDAAVALRDLGWDVEIVTRALPERRGAAHRGLRVHEIVEGREMHDLAVAIGAAQPDALLAFADPRAWPIVCSLSLPHPRPRIVVVPCVNGDGDTWLRSHPLILRHYAGTIAGAGAVGHSSNHGFDARLCADLGLPQAYVPNAVVAAEPDPGAPAKAGLDPGDPFLLVVGNHWPEKDHLGLLAHLARHDDDLPLVQVGTPSADFPEVSAQIAEAATRDPRVRLFGRATREEVAGLMQAASALLLPSRVEATPLVILEAMSHRLPWIATPGCGAVHEHAGGIIVPLDELLPTARELLADEPRRRALGEAGHDHWAACYSWEHIAPRYDALLRGARELPPLVAPSGQALAAA